MFGDAGIDDMEGGAIEDMLFGDAGDDALDGGAGIDYGLGGPDFDTCVNLETVVECEA
jgi:Ca2+-binding RTX toxin-like protein